MMKLYFLFFVFLVLNIIPPISENNLILAQTVEPSESSIDPQLQISNLVKLFESPESVWQQVMDNFGQDVSAFDLLGFSLGMVAYGIFVWHFYRFISRREIVSVNLPKNYTGGKKFSTIIVYVAKYVVVFPLAVTAWFFAYSLFLFFLSPGISEDFVFLIVIALVVAIRIAAYYKEDLSRDLAKMIPFSLLGIFLLNTTVLTVEQFLVSLNEFIPFLGKIAAFVLFAIGVEGVLRFLFLIKRKFLPVAETKLKEEIEKTIDKKIDIHVEKFEKRHEKLEEKLKETESEMDEKRNKLADDLNQKRDILEQDLHQKRDKLERDLNQKRDKLEEDLNQKREDMRDRINEKREVLEKDLNERRDKLEEDLNQKREDMRDRINEKREKLKQKVIETEKKIDETQNKLEKTKKKSDKGNEDNIS